MSRAAGDLVVEEGHLRRFLEGLGAAVGVGGRDLDYFVGGILEAELSGKSSHGLSLVPAYVGGIASGAISARPHLEVLGSTGAACVVDGGNGLGHVVLARAMDRAVEIAGSLGIGLVAVRNSNHAGMLSFAARRAVASGMVGYVTSGGPAVMAPWGGREPRLGTSPFAWAMPTGGGFPLVFDAGCSVAARRKIRQAAAANEAIPESWALDAEGAPTTDPHRALLGSLVPFGGHKGYGLALVNEVLVCGLAGGVLAAEVDSPFLRGESEELDSWRIGQIALAINATSLVGSGTFEAAVERIIDSMKSSTPAREGEPVLIPGEHSWKVAAQRRREGMTVAGSLLRKLNDLAAEVGAPPLEARSPGGSLGTNLGRGTSVTTEPGTTTDA